MTDPHPRSKTALEREWDSHGPDYFSGIRRRLRTRLLIAYVTPLVVLSTFFYFQYTSMLKEGISNHLKSIADNQRNTVDLFLQERVANLKGAFRPDAFPVPPEPAEMRRVLVELRDESPTFVDVGLFDPRGILVAYAGPYPTLRGKDYSHETWFLALRGQEADSFISDVYLGFLDKPHFVIATRRLVRGEAWVLRASVDPGKFGEFVGRSHLVEKEAEAFILNAAGTRQTIADPGAPRPANDEFIPTYRAETVVFRTEMGGTSYLAAVAWLTEIRWALVVRVPAGRAYAPVHRAMAVMTLVDAAALVLIVVVVIGSTRRVVARLEAANADKQLLQRQLFNAAKLASVGEMAAGIAHEINNPLAIIHEEASLVLDILNPEFNLPLDPAELRERLDAIVEATMRGRTITRNLLAFARDHKPVLEPSDLNALIERVLAIKDAEMRVSNIDVRTALAPSLPPVRINRNQMDQVLFNLLNNAKDAIGRDGTIAVRTLAENGEVHVEVEDTGCGMTDEQMEKIFFPFFTTKAVGKGTGLGLSISFGIIKTFGGRIEVKSRLKKGTTFMLVLPAAGPDEAPEADGGPRGAPPEGTAAT